MNQEKKITRTYQNINVGQACKEEKCGVSLIVLIITIVVVIVIAATVLLTVLNTNTLGNASEATFKSNIHAFLDEYTLYISTKRTETKERFDPEELNATENVATYTGDGKIGEINNIFDIIPSMKGNKHQNAFMIKNGEFTYDWAKLTTEEATWAEEVLKNRIHINNTDGI